MSSKLFLMGLFKCREWTVYRQADQIIGMRHSFTVVLMILQSSAMQQKCHDAGSFQKFNFFKKILLYSVKMSSSPVKIQTYIFGRNLHLTHLWEIIKYDINFSHQVAKYYLSPRSDFTEIVS